MITRGSIYTSISILGISFFTLMITGCSHGSGDKFVIDLSGEWSFQVDSLDRGVENHWYAGSLNDKIQLPGSMLTNGKGNNIDVNTPWTGGLWDSSWVKRDDYKKYRQPGNVKISFWLQPEKYYKGVAWYQKKINVPASWQNRSAEIFLERCHWETSLWIDNRKVGMQNALSAPHVYDMGSTLSPGEHTLTIRIDNRIKDIDPGRDAHSISDNTQTNWNGMIGRMVLTSRPLIYIKDVALYPDVDRKLVRVAVTINNLTNAETDYDLLLQASTINTSPASAVAPLSKKVHVGKGITQVSVDYPMGQSPNLWDEFHPNLYTLKTEIKGEGGMNARTDEFGMRKFVVKGRQMSINDRVIFLRGTLECAIFPKTGFPPTTLEEWMHIFDVCRAHGLNHVRFHSWCPPEAAFQAADRSGIYVSVEASAWAHLGTGAPIDQFIYDESNRIVSAFGNHPSFCMMAYGNEASGDNAEKFLTGFVEYWKGKDARRLYTSASGFPSSNSSDYHSTGNPRIQWWQAGLTSPINAKPPTTNFDWTTLIEKDKPTVSHEIGQWCVYPDFKEIAQYDGVLKPKNFEIFQDRLRDHGMIQLADSFLLASGKLQVLCYKADLEAAFRTPEFAGFQLLDLHDFPGQGTALVGVLNPFWKEKGYVTAREYRRFCNATVPLVRLPKLIYNNDETLTAKVEVAHYGEHPLQNVTPRWTLTRAGKKTVAEGAFKKMEIPFGNTALGTIDHPMKAIAKPEKLILTVSIDTLENSWDIWVYPSQLPTEDQASIHVTQVFDKRAEDELKKGGTVLLTIKKGNVRPQKGGDIPVGFSSIFWNTSWTNGQPPFTLGILCNPHHPALASFPTEYHSNYQWWDAMSHSNVIRLDSVESNLQPIVRVIDDWFTARPLGLIFECKVGPGRLLVSGVDLLSDLAHRPEARQLLFSLKEYMAGNRFNPAVMVDPALLRTLLISNK